MARKNRSQGTPAGPDLFSAEEPVFLSQRLALLPWPAQDRFPVNHAGATVRGTVVGDLLGSRDPLLVAGFSSIGELVDLVGRWDRSADGGLCRVVLGGEPFGSMRRSFAAPGAAFNKAVREFWQEQGISITLSGRVLQVLQAVDAGRLRVRMVAGAWDLHAKVYVGVAAVTLGSSNFTGRGLGGQIEANARFRRDAEPDRYREARRVAENCWDVGQDWETDFCDLLRDLLRFVPWQEALARACSDLLEGEWARRYLPGPGGRAQLWPSQVAGIAQALWVIDSVGSVLVADATGSGKTRMGAHLTRSVRDRLYRTGRVRSDLAVLVAPPGVKGTWEREAVGCGLSLTVISHGKLSRAQEDLEDTAVRGAQILAVDESHNFLNGGSKRTRQVAGNAADHVLLFTATPISRDARDLLSLVQMLGPDNFDDAAIEALRELGRRRGARISPAQYELLRGEIRRFTVRRTKRMLNDLVDQDPDAYRDPVTGRVNRYPRHISHVYDTAETERDRCTAAQIRDLAGQLLGTVHVGEVLRRPLAWRFAGSDEQLLAARLAAARGLAAHQVADAMRASRAALIEHIAGTAAAATFEGIDARFKASATGDQLAKLAHLERRPPRIELRHGAPDWLIGDGWVEACREEAARYRAILDLARRLTRSREEGKAALIAALQADHPRIIAFDRRPITLAVLQPLVAAAGGTGVVLATGSGRGGQAAATAALARDAQRPAAALCSDALNEGRNLQGASVIVHLDLPTTLRAAEQRVGRIDRMDSPYDTIASYWPRDGAEFATRAAARLAERARTTERLIGANLVLPDLTGTDEDALDDVDTVVEHFQTQAQAGAEWIGAVDALDPVRGLVDGPAALIGAEEYRQYRGSGHRVVSRISPVGAAAPWVFLAVAGTPRGAPRWMLLEDQPRRDTVQLDDVAERLRALLAGDPPARELDTAAGEQLRAFLHRAAALERQLLPRRLGKALQQMAQLTDRWRSDALGRGEQDRAHRWEQLRQLAGHDGPGPLPDPYLVGQAWFDLVKPRLARHQRETRTRLVRLTDITAALAGDPLPLDDMEQKMADIPDVPAIETRVAACILGVPG